MNRNEKNFHISRAARQKYQVEDSLFSLRGTVVFANFYSARLLAQKINAARDIARNPDRAVQAGELNALGLIHEILHFILQQYRQQRGDVMAQAVATLYENVGADAVETTLQKFVDQFPPLPVYRGEQTILEYLNGSSDGIPNRETVVEEMMLVWLENQNPAASPFKELFDDSPLATGTAYPVIMQNLRDYFARQEVFGPERQTLFDVLRAPFMSAPGSLSAQLDFMLYRWSAIAGRFDMGRFFARVLSGLQMIQEEQKFLFTQTMQGGGGGFTSTTPPVPTFRREFQTRTDEQGQQVWYEPEPEQFSIDLDWMPNLVLLAKSTYVWLDQLSNKYERPITTLDAIPDEELDELRRRGITGLWFIGVWERSKASATIKHWMGNSGAIASAYSLYDYEIAQEIGGTAALHQLKERAWKRGIRIASDMVPNHMGIDSRWVIEHPEWFVQNSVPPYPSYQFHGNDLSPDPRVTIQIEDHYWDKTDAAVVFKRFDHHTGDTRFIYHGNDGTSFPWNDTAQLNYLMAEVREQVIQTILHVARLTPVIRFDAAMTLAKKHYQRLWYPTPGESNTIPSRGEYTMTKAEFDAAMPEEFWREVVDRVAAEAPDTLLLAEAFWLMEGYFVRTLGMHRVYNSAFMHMLRDEKNLEYRLVIKNTIEFDPEVLKRYVNFMNNPDERTAVDQFGKGDKYFGVCIVMATMPGLPMFGHGQIEGFTERYGMEFKTAMLDETPDSWLLDRHTHEIYPLLHKRYLFAGVENFLLYDVYKNDGTVEENVYSYSNRVGNEASLVAYNNSFTEARGTIRMAAAFRDKGKDELVQRTLAEGLNLSDDENSFVIFRDHIAKLEYIRRSSELVRNGLAVSLGAYKYVVYLDFRQVQNTADRAYARLHDRLRGRGVPSVEGALHEMNLEPLHHAFRKICSAPLLQDPTAIVHTATFAENAAAFARIANEWTESTVDETAFAETLVAALENADQVNALPAAIKKPAKPLRAALDDLQTRLDESTHNGLCAFAVMNSLRGFVSETSTMPLAAWLDEWQFGRLIVEALHSAGAEEHRAWQIVSLIRIILQHPQMESVQALLANADTARFLNVNKYNDIVWFNKEAFEVLLDGYQVVGAYENIRAAKSETERNAALVKQYNAIQKLRAAQAQSEYQVEKLLAALEKPKRAATAVAKTAAPKPETAAPAKPATRATKSSTAIKPAAPHTRKKKSDTDDSGNT